MSHLCGQEKLECAIFIYSEVTNVFTRLCIQHLMYHRFILCMFHVNIYVQVHTYICRIYAHTCRHTVYLCKWYFIWYIQCAYTCVHIFYVYMYDVLVPLIISVFTCSSVLCFSVALESHGDPFMLFYISGFHIITQPQACPQAGCSQ